MRPITLTLAIGLTMGLFAFPADVDAADDELPPPAPEAREFNKKAKADPAKAAEKNPDAAASAAKPAAGEEEIDVSDLAEEYWRPQKDELEVVQNKRFTKQGRLEAG